jgi:peptidoglycan/LPS O-acetylase OafA/YrhL
MLNYTGISLAFGSIIAYCLPRQDIMPAPIRSRVFYVLSRLSFGMYLNHFWFMAPVIAFIRAHGPDPWAHPTVFSLLNFSAMALASAALATLTFCLIEHPFLQLRERILAHGRRPVAAPAASPALAEAAAGGGS